MHKLDGIIAMKIIITLMENLPGMIDHALPQFIGMLLAELKNAVESDPKAPQNYTSMILQSLSVCLFNNCTACLSIIEHEGQTIAFFSNLMEFLSKFKREFEIRRILFGLTAIIRTPLECLPPMVGAKTADLFKEIGMLAVKQYNERIDCVKVNEEDIAKGVNRDDEDDYASESEDDMDDEKEFNEIKDKLKKMNDGNAMDDDFEDEDDEDYEVEGDDNGLYDSNLDETDELLHLKETVDAIHSGAPQLFAQLSHMMNPDELNKLAEVLNNAFALKEREAKCTAALEELQKKMVNDDM